MVTAALIVLVLAAIGLFIVIIITMNRQTNQTDDLALLVTQMSERMVNMEKAISANDGAEGDKVFILIWITDGNILLWSDLKSEESHFLSLIIKYNVQLDLEIGQVFLDYVLRNIAGFEMQRPQLMNTNAGEVCKLYFTILD